MPVQAQLQAPGGVAADLQEDRPEVLIVDVKVVVIDVDRLVAIVEGVPFFAGREGLRLLLGHADEHHLVEHPALLAQPIGHLVLALPMLEVDYGNPLLGGQGLDRHHPSLGHLA